MNTRQSLGHSDTFKEQVVQHYNTSGVTMRETAKHFGITSGTVSKWVTQAGGQKSDQSEQSVEELRSEIKDLRHDLTVLKRVVCRQLLDKNPLYNNDDESSGI